MATITTRSGKGSPLTNNEVDSNFTNLNTDKVEKSGDSITGNLSFGDNNKAIFGAGSDLQIFHNGFFSVIQDNGAGSLFLQGSSAVNITNVGASETYASFNDNGAVTLRYDNAQKFATTSTGVDVTGTVVADALTVGTTNTTFLSGNEINFNRAGTSYLRQAGGGELIVTTNDGVSDKARLKLNTNGDISFYEDTGTTAKLFWDASAESLGIGTSSPSTNMEISSTQGATLRLHRDDTTVTGSNKIGRIEMSHDDTDNSGVGAYIEAVAEGSTGIVGLTFGTGTAGSASERVRITRTGNVGIGTTSPADNLHLFDSTNAGIKFTNTTSGSTASDGFSAGFDNSQTAYFWNYENGGMKFATNNAERVRIDSSGNVGIGTTSPATKLEVANTSAGVDLALRSSTTGTASLYFGDSNSIIQGRVAYNNSNNSLAFTTAASERMRITSAGNVGIGTSSPIAELHVYNGSSNADIRAQGGGASDYISLFHGASQNGLWSISTDPTVFATNNAERMRIDSSGTVIVNNAGSGNGLLKINGATGSTEAVIFQRGGTEASRIGHSNSADLTFSTGSGVSEKMRITSGGNVGIGTTSPSSALHIANATPVIRLEDTSASVSHYINSNNTELRVQADSVLSLRTSGSEAARISSGGHLLVGKTAQDTTNTVGVELKDDGVLVATVEGTTTAQAAILNRKSTDGALAEFRKNNATVGSIGVVSSDNMYVTSTVSGQSGIGFVTGAITPYDGGSETDNATSLGNATYRFKDLHLSGTANAGGLDVDGSIKLDGNYPTGNYNVALGENAANDLTTGNNNTLIGANTGANITTGRSNSLLGYAAGGGITEGDNNTLIGSLTGDSISTGSNNVGLGYSALGATTTGSKNVAVGTSAMFLNTTASFNTALGHQALRSNQTGSSNVAVGYQAAYNTTASNATAIGYQALTSNTTGSGTAVGRGALMDNTTGLQNTGIGQDALQSNTTGQYNTAVGHASLYNSTTSSQNTGVGYIALYNNTTGIRNTAVGYGAADANTTSSNITAVGWQAAGHATVTTTAVGSEALAALTSGNGNTALGRSTLKSATTATYNTAVGENALFTNQTGVRNDAFGSYALYSNTGSYNSAFGSMALYSNTTGSENVAIGYQALYNNTTGEDNTGLGQATLYANTTGSYNTAAGRLALAANTTANYNTGIGYNALNDNTTGLANTAVGALALDALTTGSNNVAVGYEALTAATTSSYNTAVGDGALQSTTSGAQNTAVGHESLMFNTTGNYNVAVGRSAARSNTTATFQTAIGFAAQSNTTTGNNNTSVGAYAGTGLTTGGNNDAFGYGAMRYATTASFNVALGIGTLQNNTAGQRNVGIGHAAGRDGTSGNDNVFVGYTAGMATTGSQNISIGANSLRANTSGGNNVSIGHAALRNSTTGSSSVAVGMEALNDVTTGHSNTAVGREAGAKATTSTGHVLIGYGAGFSVTTASELVAIGKQAFQSATTGNQVAIGTSAGYYNTTGWGNVFVGHTAARSNTTAGANVAVGGSAAYNQTIGGNNTAVGYAALYTNSTGQGNTAIGRNTLYYATGSSNTVVGHTAGYEITTGQKNTILGKFNGNQGGLDIRTSNNYVVLADGDGNPRIVVDNSGNTGIGTTSPSYALDVAGNSTTVARFSNTGVANLSVSSSGSRASLVLSDSAGTNGAINSTTGNGIAFGIGSNFGSNEAMRIDSSGNLLVGKTSSALNTAGFEVASSGRTRLTRDSANVVEVNRTTNDGSLVTFNKDGSTVGSIRTISADSIGIGTGDAGLRFVSGTNRIQPVDMDNGLNSDALTSLGDTNKRFKDLYLSGGVYLGGTGSANKLDDYEEGSWTVVITGETSGSVTTTTTGYYTKVGHMVTCAFYLNESLDLTSISGVVNVSLPFTSNTWHGGGSVVYANALLSGSAEADTSISVRPIAARARLVKGSSTDWIDDSEIEKASGSKTMMFHAVFEV